jgi:hypothetical protein
VRFGVCARVVENGECKRCVSKVLMKLRILSRFGGGAGWSGRCCDATGSFFSQHSNTTQYESGRNKVENHLISIISSGTK